jgi:DNA polymerase V
MTKFPSGNGASGDGASGDGAPSHLNPGSAGCLGLTADTAWKADTETDAQCPLFLSSVQAGFPSPAGDYVEATLDLNEALIDNETVDNETVDNETSTFFVRVSGDSMKEIGIHDGDIIVVDRSVEPSGGDVVVAALDGELTGKRYRMRNGQPLLMPENASCDPIPIEEGQSLVVWGVVTRAIREIS